MDVKMKPEYEAFDVKQIGYLLTAAESAPPGDKQCDAFIQLLTHLTKVPLTDHPEFACAVRQKCKTIESNVNDLIETGTIDFDKGIQLMHIGSILLKQTEDYSSFDYDEQALDRMELHNENIHYIDNDSHEESNYLGQFERENFPDEIEGREDVDGRKVLRHIDNEDDSVILERAHLIAYDRAEKDAQAILQETGT